MNGGGLPLPELARRRVGGTFEIDEWGLDRDLIEILSPLFGVRWRIDVEGAEHVPVEGPAVLVFNRRAGVSEPFVLARGVRLATGRFVRPLGAPDVAPVGPVLRRLGAVLDRPDEMAGLLRRGEVVAVSLARELRHRHRAGPVQSDALAPALDAPVIPVAVVGREVGRRWRVVVGKPVERPSGLRGPLAVAELAEGARHGVQELLGEAFPPRWPLG